MTERGQRLRSSNKTVGYIAAIVVHAVIIGAVFINFTNKNNSETVEAAFAEKVDVVRATTIEESEIQKQQELLKQQDRDKQKQQELEQQRLKDLQAKAEQEKQRIEDLKKQQEQEKEKAAELEKEREALALKRKEEEEEREKELAERKKEEAEEAERKKKLAEEKEREEQLAQQKLDEEQAERQRLLQESLAAEQAFLAEQISKERATTLTQKHLALIAQQIKNVRTLDPGIESWRKTLVNIKVSSSGAVTAVRTLESSGSPLYDRSVETAIFKASPLDIPPASIDANLHQQFLDFDFLVKVSD